MGNSNSTMIIGIVLVALIVVLIFAPPLISQGLQALRDMLSDVRDIFSEDQNVADAQLSWFVGLPDGTEQNVDAASLSVFYGGQEIDYIGFVTQIKLTYTGTITTIRYNAQMTMSFNGEDKETRSSGLETSTRIGNSGEWFGLTSIVGGNDARFTMDSTTIQTWGESGDHTLGANVELDLHIVREDEPNEDLSGTASGTSTITIDKDPVTLETRVNTVTFSTFPSPLS